MRQKRPRSPALRQSEAATTQRPGRPAEAGFAVARAPAQRRSAKIGTSRAGEKKATDAVHGASSELLPEMADLLWLANPLHRLLPISWGEITRALVTLSARSTADPVHATTAAANLELTIWREAVEIWIGTAMRWWGLVPATPARPDGAELRRAAAVHSAVDQQVLCPRPAAEEQSCPLPARARLLGIHDQLEEPGRFDGGHHLRGLHDRRPARRERRRPRDHRGRAHQPRRLLHRRNAAGDDAGLSGGAAGRPLRCGHVHGIALGLFRGRRHGGVHRRAADRLHGAADARARLSR